MAKRIQIIGQSLVVTDTLTGDDVFDRNKGEIYYDSSYFEDSEGIKFVDQNKDNQQNNNGIFETIPLTDAVDENDIQFTFNSWKVFVRENVGFNAGTGGSVPIVQVFDNYTDLTTQLPAGVGNRFAYVENSEGSKWLPWSIGGTYHGAGLYYDNGTDWTNANDEIFKGLQDLNVDVDAMAFVKIDEGSGTGYILRGQDRTDFNIIGAGTLDLTEGDSDLIPRGSTGQNGFANGYNLLGNGYAQLLLGWDNRGNGNYCLVDGISNDTFGGGCVVVGEALSNQGGDKMGIFGRANTLPTGNPYGLQVGNGTVSSTGSRVLNAVTRSDAFRVYRSGLIEAPSCTNTLIDTIGEKSLTTKEYVDKFYQFFQGTGTEYAGQTTIPLMNQQANVFETYVEKSFLITRTDNYRIDLSFISSLNTPNYDFIALLDINDGTTTETLTIQTEPKDSVGTGILVDVIQGGVIQPQVITSTNQRNATTFAFNRQLVAGLTYTFTLRFGCDNANRRATMYQAQIMIEQKTLIL